MKDLRAFLGLMGYYRRLVKDFAKIAKPLTNILREKGSDTSKKKITLDLHEIECFNKIKQLLSSSDILIYSDFNKPFILTTDASNFAIGSALSR